MIIPYRPGPPSRAVVAALVAVVVALVVALSLVGPHPAAATGATGPYFGNATYTGAPICRDLLLPQLNPDTPLHVCAIVRRPEGGGGLHLVSLFTADGILGTHDLADVADDCFGADLFASRFTGTIKLVVNCKPRDAANGNDRVIYYRDTGIPAAPAGG